MLENLCDLLFELSNEDRLRILYQLEKEAMNISDLSKTLELSTQESSRNLSRLSGIGLTNKDACGLHRLTLYGKLALSLLPSFAFLQRHKTYIFTHDISFLPQRFIYRIGQLSDCEKINNVDSALTFVGDTFSKAKRYVWCITDTLGANLTHHSWKPNQEKIEFRVILPKSLSLDYFRPIQARASFYLPYARAREIKISFLNDPKLTMVISEEKAIIAFPDVNGRIDYRLSFTGKNPFFHQWCEDLFKYYWDRSARMHARDLT